MEEMTASDAANPPVPLPDLVLSLEQAAQLANQLPSTSDPNHIQQIYSALHLAHHHLASFLQSPPPENSVSSATGAGEQEDNNSGEPMQVGEDEEEENSMAATINKVEERMKNCFIKNKRQRKRPLSPSSAADDGYVDGRIIKGAFDPLGTRLRALDLIDQFHA